MTGGPPRSDAFPSAEQDATRAEAAAATPQTAAPSYRLAFDDREFLLRDELRPVRLQLELLKPELLLNAQGITSTIVVFGSARIPDPDGGEAPHKADQGRYYSEARSFGRLVSAAGQATAERQYVIITGGGGGIMEAANRGADDAGAVSIGLNITLPMEQPPNPYITPELCFQFHYFALRKMHFLMRARALVIFPGGFGTLDELFDALTLIQTRKITPMPVLLFGEAYWRRIIDFEAMAAEGMIAPEDVKIMQYVETAEEAWRIIQDFYDGDR